MMPNDTHSLASLEPMEGPAYDDYRERVQGLIERRLTRAERIKYLFPAAGGFVMALILTALAITEPDTTPANTRWILFGMGLVGAGWCYIGCRTLLRGSLNLLVDQRDLARFALLVSSLQTAVFGLLWSGEGSVLPALILSLVFVIISAALLIIARIQEAALRIRIDGLGARASEP